jgi:hypothetical protein
LRDSVGSKNVGQAAHRQTKRDLILKMFAAKLGVRTSSAILHARYGSSFRTRVSELNRDSGCPLVIRNQTEFVDGIEQSVYWSELKGLPTDVGNTLSLFPEGMEQGMEPRR